jgi:hypothetical protein
MRNRLAMLARLGAIVVAGAAVAEEFRDPKTGLAVDPPPGFTARLGEPIPGDLVQIEVERREPDTSCSVSFSEGPANRAYTQQQLNDVANKPEWLELLRTIMGAMHEVLSLERRTQDGAVGAVMVLKSKMEFLANLRTFQGLFETPLGRTVITCATQQDKFETFRPDYEAILKGVKLPR